MIEWMVHIRIMDILFGITALNYFSVAPKEVHLKILVKVFGGLDHTNGSYQNVVVTPEYIRELVVKGGSMIDCLYK